MRIQQNEYTVLVKLNYMKMIQPDETIILKEITMHINRSLGGQFQQESFTN